MTDELNGATPAPSDANTDNANNNNATETISRAEFEKVLNEMHSYKKKAKQYEEKMNEDKTNRMKEQNQWKELAEAREREALEAKQTAERLQNSFIGERKFNAVKEKCLSMGIRPEAISDLEMLDLESVQIETTSTGKINILGADKFAERIKSLKPHWFSDKTPPAVNINGARVIDHDGTVTPQMILAAEKESLKTGDKTKYYELHKKYINQRLAKR